MNDTAIYKQLSKIFADPTTVEHYLERIFTYTEGEWVFPDKKGDWADFSIFSDIEFYSIVSKKIIPIWSDGSFKGSRVAFLYKKDLKYTS